MSQPTPAGPALKVAEDRRGVKKGSRILPLLVAAAIIVGFVAYAVKRPTYDVKLITVERAAQVPDSAGARPSHGWWRV